jgi:hypothetical protein
LTTFYRYRTAFKYYWCPIYQRGWLWYWPLFGNSKSEGEAGSE